VGARLFLQPFKKTELAALQGFGFGVGGSWGNVSSNAAGLPATTGGALPGYFTDGQQQFFAYNPTNGTVVANGIHWRVTPQAYYYIGPVGVLGEYAISDQRVTKGATSTTLQNTAWQVAANWVLTGEAASYMGITPKKPFDPLNGHWGALQLVGRYAELDVDDDAFPIYSNPLTSASGAQAWSVGLNWYLNRNLRLNTSYSRTTFTGGSGSTGTATSAPGTVTHQPEEVFFTRVQVAF
jgi:phosphate-selective porin OprO/OprP